MIIQRPEETKLLKESKKWILIYGRRKTGKSFLAENFIDYDEYFFVKRDRTIISKKDEKTVSYDTFIAILKRELEKEKTIIVDEFHRLGNDFFDILHESKKKGKLIIISSTLSLSKKLLGEKSPLLGFFMEMPLGLISLSDCLGAISQKNMERKAAVELAIMLREPISIDYSEENKTPRVLMAKILSGSIKTIPAMIGEIFTEEDRTLSKIYEGILRAVAGGHVISGEISSYLFSRKLIDRDNPGITQQYLVNLVEFGIIKKLPVYGKNKFVYKHLSPLARLFYYADEKYNISEKKMNESQLLRIIDELMPRIVEDHLREFLAEKLNLGEAVIEANDYDVDACLLKFNKIDTLVEIKWKTQISAGDIEKAEQVFDRFPAKRKLFFVPDKKMVKQKTKLEVVDIMDFIEAG